MLLKENKHSQPSFSQNPPKTRSKTPSQPRPSSQTPTIRRKFTPTLNKSFICYKDQPVPRHSRASSYDRSRDLAGKSKTRQVKSLKNSRKTLINPGEVQYIGIAKAEMNAGNHAKAAELLNKAVKADNTNLEALYSRGVSLMHLQKHEKAVKDFLLVMGLDPGFDKQLYIALYMCYSCLGKAAQGLKILNKGLRRFPSFAQGFLMRGQIYSKAKKFEKALKDFNKVLKLDQSNSNVIINIAEAYIGLNEYESALKAVKIGANRPELAEKSNLLKIKLEFYMKKYDCCGKTIQKFCKAWPEEKSVFYYKGLILMSQDQYTDALLSFEQVIQGNNDSDLVSRSLLNIGKLKIKERDFYGALHTFERSLETGQNSELRSFHKYTEGVICLMKRKLEEGVRIFTEIISENESVLQEYLGDCYENRAFAFFSLKKYSSAFDDFKKILEIKPLEKASEFNSAVSQALLQEANGDFFPALNLLKKCKKLFPRNIMPGLCRASILISLSQNSKDEVGLVDKAERLIDRCLKNREPESEVFFFKSIVSFVRKDFAESNENAKKAIEKADENIAVHYLNRAFSYICLKKYEEAIQDLTICTQLNEDLNEVYIYRAICAFLQDDLQLSIDDLKLVQEKCSNDLKISLKVAKLFAVIGSPKDSLEALQYLDEQDPILLTQNYLLLNDFLKAKRSLNSLPKSPELNTDLEITEFLLTLQTDSQLISQSADKARKIQKNFGFIFNKKYACWMAGVILLYNNEFEAASNCFQTVLEVLHEEPEIFADSITIEEENCEILYNLALCSFKSPKDETKLNALMILEELSEVLNEKHRGQLLFLSALLELTQKNKKKAEKLMKEAVKSDSETLSPFLDNKEVQVFPLHTSDEFSSIFPLISLNVDEMPTVYVRPAVVLPHPCIDFSFEELEKQVLVFFSTQNVTPKPEAPWLLRVKGSIQFTDGLIEDLQTEEDSQKPEKKTFETSAKSQSILRKRSFFSEKSLKKINEDSGLGFGEKIRNLCNG